MGLPLSPRVSDLTPGRDARTSAAQSVLTLTRVALAAPTSGAKVRLVYLAAGAATPVRLTIPAPTTTGTDTDLTSDVAFGTASAFAQVNAGPLNLKIVNVTTGPPPTHTVVRTQVLAVGDGSGSGTGTKNFEAGKIYTIVVRGLAGAGVPTAQQPQAVIIQNN